MPTGTPTPAQLWNGEVSFFSLDTDLIQSAGYDFDKGALNQLPKQLPRAMRLQLTEIVTSEIIDHLLEPVLEDARNFTKLAGELTRRAQVKMSAIQVMFAELYVEDGARALFRERVEAFTLRCRGGILPVSGTELAAEIFNLYFAKKPPFAARKDKKSEFPDAMSLVLLERFARDQKTLGIIASGDDGWNMFAGSSPYLYCVRSVDDLAKLFVDAGEHGERITARVLAAAKDHNSLLRASVSDALSRHVENADWTIGEIYSSGSTRVEAEAHGANLFEFSITTDEIKIWNLEEEPSTWVVEIEVLGTAEVEVQITHYVWDSIDREEFKLNSDTISLDRIFEAQVYLTCVLERDDTPPEEWGVEVEIAAGHYEIELGEVDPFPDE
jgi:hypothetical protein